MLTFLERVRSNIGLAVSGGDARVQWVDGVKGFTILLVVLHHAQEGVRHSIGFPPEFDYYYRLLSPVRMPLFFMVAGLFASRSINGPLRSFLDGKVVHFGYFYLLWSLIIFGFRFGLNSITNNTTEAHEILLILWDPLPTIWFLYALLISFVALRLLRGLPVPVVVALAAAVQGTALVTGTPFTGLVILDKLAPIFLYFVIGVYSADWIKAFAAKATMRRLLLAALIFAAIASAARLRDAIEVPLWYFSISASSAALLITAASLFSGKAWFRLFTVVGKHSFQIYLTHFAAVAAVRIAFVAVGVRWQPAIIVVAIMSAVLFAIMLDAAVRSTPFQFLFYRPERLKLSRSAADAVAVPAPRVSDLFTAPERREVTDLANR